MEYVLDEGGLDLPLVFYYVIALEYLVMEPYVIFFGFRAPFPMMTNSVIRH